MSEIQNIYIADSSAMTWLFLAAIMAAVWLIATILYKTIGAITINKLKKLRRNGHIQEFKRELDKALRESIQSETNDDSPTISTYHKNLLRIYKSYVLESNPSAPLGEMLVLRTAVSLKQEFTDLRKMNHGVELEQKTAQSEQLRKDVLSELSHYLK